MRVEGWKLGRLKAELRTGFSSSFSSFVLEFRLLRARTIKTALDPKFGLGGRAVRTDAVFDGDLALLILAEGRINQAVVVADVAVDDGEVFFLDGAGFPDFAEFAGDFGIFGDEDDAAGFTVEAVD